MATPLAPLSGKRKRVVLSLEKKLELLERLDKGEKTSALAEEYGVGVSTIIELRHSKSRLREFVGSMDPKDRVRRKVMKKSNDDKLEKALYLWFVQERSKGMSISASTLAERALFFSQHINYEKERLFKASSGWLEKFKKRHGIQHLKNGGEQSVPAEDEVELFQERLRTVMEYEHLLPDQVYTLSETGLYWRLLPKKALVAAHDFQRQPLIFNEDVQRVTMLLCVNATGSHKLKPLFVGDAKVPNCLKHVKLGCLPVSYKQQRDALMDVSIMKDWFLNEFFPQVTHHLRENGLPQRAILVLENSASHPNDGSLQSADGAITCVFLPRNATCKLQPMQQGVIESVKRDYRKSFLSLVVSEKCAGKSMMSLLQSITIREAIYFVDSAWKAVPQQAITKAWCHSILPDWPEGSASKSDTCDATLLDQLRVLRLSEKDMEDWIHCDRDLPVCATLSDMEIVQFVGTDASFVVEQESEEEDDDDCDSLIMYVPSHNAAVNHFERSLIWLEHQDNCDTSELLALRKLLEKARDKRYQEWKRKSAESCSELSKRSDGLQ